MEAGGAIAAMPTHKADLTALAASQGGHLLVQGFSNGVLRVSEAQPGNNSPLGMQTC